MARTFNTTIAMRRLLEEQARNCAALEASSRALNDFSRFVNLPALRMNQPSSLENTTLADW
jgi:hypothetical protein